jgi:PKD repeat protein
MSYVNKIVAGLGGKSVCRGYRRIFNARFATVLALVLSLCVLTSLGVQAERATPQEMERVCQNWLTHVVFERGAWAGETSPQIEDVHEIIVNDTVLARCFSIAPNGYVVVPVLKELPPVKANSEECNLDVNKEYGFPQLLREVLLDRVRAFVKTYGSLDATQPSNGDVLFGKVHGQQWDRFSVDPDEFETSLNKGVFAPMDIVGPLLTTSWHQSAPYNNNCPWGDGGRCIVGCVATAATQIMAYYQWPKAGYGNHTYYWSGDNSCGGSTPGQWLTADFSDPYDWANMADDCPPSCSPAEEDALAELNYEVGVAFEMDFGHCASGLFASQIPSCMNAFETNFRYHDQMVQNSRLAYTSENWFNLIKTEINEDRPIWYFITSHSIVCDGWIEDGDEKLYHMNYGWDDWHTTWYALDDYHCPGGDPDSCYQEHEFIVRNIAPDKGIWLSADTTFGWAPFDVLFTGSSEYSVVEWIWDFGDGDSAFIQSPVHMYETPDMFDITLAIDTGGDTLTLQRSDYVIVLADSMIAVDTAGSKGDTVEVVIRARNTIPLKKIIIPIETFGNLNVTYPSEGFSTAGCRTDYFETQSYLHYYPPGKTYTIKLETSSIDLQPGEGPILKLYFIIPGSASSGQTDTVELDGYNQFLPSFSGSIAEYQAVPVAGTISFLCCNDDGLRGDVDYSGGSPNVGDLSYLVSHLFDQPPGPAPPCFEEGDIDGSGSINVGDLSYLVSYLFDQPPGPAPLPCP